MRSAEGSSATSSPAVGLGPEYLIVREIFLVQDSRPLYHYPEVDLLAPPKPKPSEEVVVVVAGDADTATADDNEDDEEDNEDNEDDIGEHWMSCCWCYWSCHIVYIIGEDQYQVHSTVYACAIISFM